MTLELVVGILLKLAQDLLKAKLAERLDSLAELPPVKKALRSIAADPEVDAEIVPLTKWVESQEFARIVERLAAGERNLTDEAIAKEFVSKSDFYAGEDQQETLRVARALLRRFGEWIEFHLYESKSGQYAQMKRIELLHAESAGRDQSILEIAQETKSKVAEIANVLLPNGETGERSPEEEKLHGRVDVARDLINAGKSRTALEILKGIRTELEEKSPSVELQFRIATNLGACYLDLGDPDSALDELGRARTLKPKNAQVEANVAMAAIATGNAKLALECSEAALSISPDDPHGITVRLWATHEFDRNEFDRIRDTIGPEEPSSEICLMLGELSIEDEAYQDAEKWLQRGIALSAGKEHPDAHSLLAVAIFRPMQLKLAQDLPHIDRIPQEEWDRIREAENELTKAIPALETRDNRARLVTALSNRASIRSLLGSEAEARDDLDRALSEAPQHPEALSLTGLCSLFYRPKKRTPLSSFGAFQTTSQTPM